MFFFQKLQDIKDEATINSLLSHRKIRFNIYPNKEVSSSFTMSKKPARKTVITVQKRSQLDYLEINISLTPFC